MKTTSIFFTGILAGGLIIAAIAFKYAPAQTGKQVQPGTQPASGEIAAEPGNRSWEYRWHAPQVPDAIDFAGEQTPLDRWEVRERLDRELLVNSYLHGSTLYILKLAGRMFPVLEERLKANGVPEDFKYLCVAESALQNQRSPAGAIGYWQFLNSSGKERGLEITDQVDERYHLEKATDAACRYLKSAYDRFGSWTAAAASYNCGMGGYSRFSSHQQSQLLRPAASGRNQSLYFPHSGAEIHS